MPRAAPSRPKEPQPRPAIASPVLPIAADIALPARRGTATPQRPPRLNPLLREKCRLRLALDYPFVGPVRVLFVEAGERALRSGTASYSSKREILADEHWENTPFVAGPT